MIRIISFPIGGVVGPFFSSISAFGFRARVGPVVLLVRAVCFLRVLGVRPGVLLVLDVARFRVVFLCVRLLIIIVLV